MACCPSLAMSSRPIPLKGFPPPPPPPPVFAAVFKAVRTNGDAAGGPNKPAAVVVDSAPLVPAPTGAAVPVNAGEILDPNRPDPTGEPAVTPRPVLAPVPPVAAAGAAVAAAGPRSDPTPSPPKTTPAPITPGWFPIQRPKPRSGSSRMPVL